jgi:predicted RNA binding protein YcfA (HicA-like mRNA interferase family)
VPSFALNSATAGTIIGSAKIRDVLDMIQQDGWREVRQRGSHKQFKHPTKPGLVTVAGHPGDDIAKGTLNSIKKQAGLK